MTKYALSVGINDYPGSSNDLQGCVNDANGWSRLLASEGYRTTTLLNDQATRAYVAAELARLVSMARFGDRLVFTYSGHGSWVPDKDGDEADARDECLVLHDWQQAGYLTDDDLYRIFQVRRAGVRVSIFSDSCHSGTVARFVNDFNKAPRFFSPALLGVDPKAYRGPKTRDVGSRPGTVLFGGCDDLEYSYDAFIDGKPQGAFSATALATYSHGLTYRAWHQLIRGHLPSDQYPQSPTLHATGWQRYWRL